MIAKVIRYIGFSLYNCVEKTVYRIWKPRKLMEFHFDKFVSTLMIYLVGALDGEQISIV